MSARFGVAHAAWGPAVETAETHPTPTNLRALTDLLDAMTAQIDRHWLLEGHWDRLRVFYGCAREERGLLARVASQSNAGANGRSDA
jgi:hypothetical protein